MRQAQSDFDRQAETTKLLLEGRKLVNLSAPSLSLPTFSCPLSTSFSSFPLPLLYILLPSSTFFYLLLISFSFPFGLLFPPIPSVLLSLPSLLPSLPSLLLFFISAQFIVCFSLPFSHSLSSFSPMSVSTQCKWQMGLI